MCVLKKAVILLGLLSEIISPISASGDMSGGSDDMTTSGGTIIITTSGGYSPGYSPGYYGGGSGGYIPPITTRGEPGWISGPEISLPTGTEEGIKYIGNAAGAASIGYAASAGTATAFGVALSPAAVVAVGAAAAVGIAAIVDAGIEWIKYMGTKTPPVENSEENARAAEDWRRSGIGY